MSIAFNRLAGAQIFGKISHLFSCIKFVMSSDVNCESIHFYLRAATTIYVCYTSGIMLNGERECTLNNFVVEDTPVDFAVMC